MADVRCWLLIVAMLLCPDSGCRGRAADSSEPSGFISTAGQVMANLTLGPCIPGLGLTGVHLGADFNHQTSENPQALRSCWCPPRPPWTQRGVVDGFRRCRLLVMCGARRLPTSGQLGLDLNTSGE